LTGGVDNEQPGHAPAAVRIRACARRVLSTAAKAPMRLGQSSISDNHQFIKARPI